MTAIYTTIVILVMAFIGQSDRDARVLHPDAPTPIINKIGWLP